MRSIPVMTLALVVAATGVATAAQPGPAEDPGRIGAGTVINDDCEDAIPVEPNGQVAGTTLEATPDGTASCGSSDSSPDVWYTLTSDIDCTATAETCSEGAGCTDYDTVLSVHDGCPPGGGEITCNDDECSLQSRVTWEAVAGQTYWLRVSGFSGAAGDFTLTTSCIVCEGTLEVGPPRRLRSGEVEIDFEVWVKHNNDNTVFVPVVVSVHRESGMEVTRKVFDPMVFRPGDSFRASGVLTLPAGVPIGTYRVVGSIAQMASLPSLQKFVKIVE